MNAVFNHLGKNRMLTGTARPRRVLLVRFDCGASLVDCWLLVEKSLSLKFAEQLSLKTGLLHPQLELLPRLRVLRPLG